MDLRDTFRKQEFSSGELLLTQLSDFYPEVEPQAKGTYLVKGGQVIWQSGLTFNVTPAQYYINGIFYTSDAQTITLNSNSAGGNPRRDTFYLDVNSTFGAEEGTPASDPQAPTVDPETQIDLTDVLISTSDTLPDVSNTLIYDENAQVAGGEWNTFTDNVTVVDFAETVDPYKNTIHIDYDGDGTKRDMRFTAGSSVSVPIDTKLVMAIKPVDNMKTPEYISIQLEDTGGDDFFFTNLRNGQHGFNGFDNTWQEIAIPLDGGFFYTQGSSPFAVDRLYLNVGPKTTDNQFYVDYIYLQTGLPQPGPIKDTQVKVGNTLFVDTVYGNDQTGERENFIKPYATGEAAEDDAQAGDTIVFRPGTHTITDGMGKDQVTYYIEAGAEVQSDGSTTIFSDGGSTMQFNVVGDGKMTPNGGTFLNLSGSSTLVSVNINQLEFNGGTSNRMFYLHTNDPELYLRFNYGRLNGDVSLVEWDHQSNVYVWGNALICDGRTCYHKGSSTSSTLEFNYLYTASANSFDASVKSRYGGGYFKFHANRWEMENTGGGCQGIYIDGGGGTIEFSGHMIADSNLNPVYLETGKVILNKATIELLDNGGARNLNVCRLLSGTVECIDTEIINHCVNSGCHGFRCTGTTNPTLTFKNTTVKLHTTAVGAGAKGISSSSSINVKAFSDTGSNGDMNTNVTNLVAGTALYTDSEIKSA